MPVLATSFLLTALAGVGFPGTLGFVGQELLVDGAVAEHPRTGFLVIVAGAFAGIAVLRIYFSLFCGRSDRGPSLGLGSREVLILASFSALLLATGLAPRPILGSRAAAATEILATRPEASP
jgi:NADH-quinone oxidoreductase subunit M